MDFLTKFNEYFKTEDTKYLRWYISLVTSRQSRVKLKGDYTERHHIFPKCLFGENNETVVLTFREHYLAHLFLVLHVSNSLGKCEILFKLVHPIWRMRGIKKNQFCEISCKPFSRTYNISRKLYLDSIRGRPKSEETKRRMREYHQNNPMSLETKAKISKAMSGDKNHRFGKKVSSEHSKKLSELMTGKIMSEEFCKNLSITRTGELHPLYGKNHSDKTKKQMSESHKKSYILLTESGEFLKTTELGDFCKSHLISYCTLLTYSKNNKFYKGYKILSKY